MSTLEVQSLSVRVGARCLLDGVSLEAEPGEIVAVIGPNGAGKTTLLEAIVGLTRAVNGEVRFAGRTLASFRSRAKTFSFLPDGAELPSEARVGTLLDAALGTGARSDELVSLLRRVLEVDALVRTPAGVLSRGERQRVSLFAALAVARPVVVLDEPFAVFDPLKLRSVLDVVESVAESGATLIAAVHQLSQAERVADRVLLLAGGRRVAWGSPAALAEEAGGAGSLEDVFVALLSRGEHAA